MVFTRSQYYNMEAMTLLIDTKFNELRESLLTQFKSSIDKFVEDKKEELISFITAKKNEIEPELISEYSTSIKSIQQHVLSLKAENIVLTKRIEDLQQYVRRPNLRIFGVPLGNKETSEDVVKIVENTIESNDLNIPLSSIDRAHRIGNVFNSGEGINKVRTQPIIVRFTTFRDRTKYYRARKGMREKFGISLDLTADRYGLLKDARKHVENVEGFKFAYADFNCNLRILTTNGKHLLFDSMTSLHDLIASL